MYTHTDKIEHITGISEIFKRKPYNPYKPSRPLSPFDGKARDKAEEIDTKALQARIPPSRLERTPKPLNP